MHLHSETQEFSHTVTLGSRLEVAQVDTNLVVHEEWASHMLFDRHGNVLPVAIHFNYIESGIDESHFDLKALAEALLQLRDVRVLPGDGGRMVKTKDGYARDTSSPKSAKEALFNISGYNASEGRTRSVQFVWQPSKEDYAKVWEWAQKHDKKYPSTCLRAGFWALDIHGLSRFRRIPLEE